ncbi:hypothetical protein Tco_0396700 [Tanacetum coccineum]
MLTKPQFFYDHTTKQALGFQIPFYLKKAQQLEPNLYDGNVIKNMGAIVISEETLMLAEESRSKMLLKQKDPMMLEKKVKTTPVDYAILNQLSQDFETQFVPQTELSAEQAFWSQNSINSPDPTISSRPIKVEVPKELPKSSWFGYIKNHKKTVKNKQARTREPEEYKADARKAKPQSKSAKKSQSQSKMVTQAPRTRHSKEAVTKEAQMHPKENDTLAILRCPQLDQTATIDAQMIEEMIGQD